MQVLCCCVLPCVVCRFELTPRGRAGGWGCVRLERESAVEFERSLSKERVREVIERYDSLMATQRATLSAEAEAERKRWMAEHSTAKEDVSRALSAAQQTHESRVAQLKAEHASALQALKRTHELALAQHSEAQAIERDQWQKSVTAKLNAQLAERSNAMRSQFAAEQREELELVITRLTKEHNEAMQLTHAQAEQRVTELKRYPSHHHTTIVCRADVMCVCDVICRMQATASAEAKKRESALNGQILAAQRINTEMEQRLTATSAKLTQSQLHVNELQSSVNKLNGWCPATCLSPVAFACVLCYRLWHVSKATGYVGWCRPCA